jgi:dynein heavy chain 1
VEKYIQNRLPYALLWGFGGSMSLSEREAFGTFLASQLQRTQPPAGANILDCYPHLESGDWLPWKSKVESVDIETHKVGSPDVVIATVDTVRHEEVMHSWLTEHRPLLLCGPPGYLLRARLTVFICTFTLCFFFGFFFFFFHLASSDRSEARARR